MQTNDTSNWGRRALQAIAAFGQRVGSDLGLGEEEVLELVLESIHEQLSTLIVTDNVYLVLNDGPTDTVRLAIAMINGKRVEIVGDESSGPCEVAHRLTDYIIRTGQAGHSNAIEETHRTTMRDYIDRIPKSWIGTPMKVKDEILGAVVLWNDERENVYDENDLEVLRTIAGQTAVAIENARLYESLEQRFEEQTRQLREAQERALAAEVNAAVGLVTAEAAHHSKNLAGIIRSCVIRLRRQLQDLTPQQEEDLDNILLNSEGILRSAEDLFKPFRSEPKAEVSVDLMLQEAIHVSGKQPNIDIRVNLAPDLPKVNVQVQKVITYVTELLNNAVKFTRKRMQEMGVAQEQIEVTGQLADDGFVELTFMNHGPPIPRERWEEIFQLFSAREEVQEPRGYGLGLWGARITMRALGGDVYVLESNEERTVFLLRLPSQRNGD